MVDKSGGKFDDNFLYSFDFIIQGFVKDLVFDQSNDVGKDRDRVLDKSSAQDIKNLLQFRGAVSDSLYHRDISLDELHKVQVARQSMS